MSTKRLNEKLMPSKMEVNVMFEPKPIGYVVSGGKLRKVLPRLVYDTPREAYLAALCKLNNKIEQVNTQMETLEYKGKVYNAQYDDLTRELKTIPTDNRLD